MLTSALRGASLSRVPAIRPPGSPHQVSAPLLAPSCVFEDPAVRTASIAPLFQKPQFLFPSVRLFRSSLSSGQILRGSTELKMIWDNWLTYGVASQQRSPSPRGLSLRCVQRQDRVRRCIVRNEPSAGALQDSPERAYGQCRSMLGTALSVPLSCCPSGGLGLSSSTSWVSGGRTPERQGRGPPLPGPRGGSDHRRQRAPCTFLLEISAV